eukprot:gene9355-19407_t
MELRTSRVDNVPGIAKKATATRPVSLYKLPPEEELTLDEFELTALDRLQFLRGIETLKTRGIDGEEYTSKMIQLEKRYFPVSVLGKAAEQRKDQISHFILRLAYCRTEDLRRWFITQEAHLLKFRLDRLSDQERADFMTSNDLRFELLSNDAKNSRREELIGLAGVDEMRFSSSVFYKIPFSQALSLVASRQVYLEGGYAHVPLSKLVSIIIHELQRGMQEASRMFEFITVDSRIGPLLKNMSKQYVGGDFNGNKSDSTDKLHPEQ